MNPPANPQTTSKYNFDRTSFYLKITCPILAFLMIMLVIRGILDLSLNKRDLRFKPGQIEDIKINFSPKNKTESIQIKIQSDPQYFYLQKEDCNKLEVSKIKIHDTIVVYFRPEYMTTYFKKNQEEIYHLEFQNQVLFDLKNRKKEALFEIAGGTFLFFVFSIPFYLFVIHRPSGAKSKPLID